MAPLLVGFVLSFSWVSGLPALLFYFLVRANQKTQIVKKKKRRVPTEPAWFSVFNSPPTKRALCLFYGALC